MSFAALSTGALVALALASAATVVALYLLRRTPRMQTVSNVEFWRRAASRSRPRSLFATRVPWAAMLVSLAIAMLLVAELGDPRPGAGLSGVTVIVLDADRSMAAVGANGRRRVDEAISIARATAQASTAGGEVAIVRAGAHPTILVPRTRRAPDADRALATVEADDETADLPAAVALARAIVRGAGAGGRVVVVADRDDYAHPGDAVPVALAPVGAAEETVAITAFDARRDPDAMGEYHLRCEVRSYSERRARARLVVRDRDTVISEEALSFAPGEVKTHRAQGFSSAQGELTARLEDVVIDGGRDALARDDVAFAAVAPVVATRVLLVTPGDRYLASALAANPSVALETVDAAGLAARRSSLSHYDVVVLDRVAPEPPVDHPALLLVGIAGSAAVRAGADLDAPRVTAVAAEHRVLAGLRFEQIQIARARRLVPDADDRVLLRSGRDPLALARDRGGRRLVALGFDVQSTDLARRVAFPLFMHNALVWLDRREREFRAYQAPGEPLRASAPSAVVLTPSGAARAARGALYDTGRAGIYHTDDRAIAVSAADEAGALTGVEGRREAFGGPATGRAPLTLVLAAVILLLLCGEWFFTLRGRLQ